MAVGEKLNIQKREKRIKALGMTVMPEQFECILFMNAR